MKLKLRHKLPAVVGAAVLLTAASGAAAFALVATQSDDAGTDAGNSLPIDDNHPSVAPTPHAVRTPEPGDDRSTGEVEPGDDKGTTQVEPGDDKGTTQVDSGDGNSSRMDGSGDVRRGSDNATPEPSESTDRHGSNSGSDDSSTAGSAPSTADGSGSGSGSDDGGGGGGSDDGGGHGSDG